MCTATIGVLGWPPSSTAWIDVVMIGILKNAEVLVVKIPATSFDSRRGRPRTVPATDFIAGLLLVPVAVRP